MIRRAADVGIETKIGCHSFRTPGITEYLCSGGKLEVAQQMANDESARTTGLYDRRNDQVSLDEVEEDCDVAPWNRPIGVRGLVSQKGRLCNRIELLGNRLKQVQKIKHALGERNGPSRIDRPHPESCVSRAAKPDAPRPTSGRRRRPCAPTPAPRPGQRLPPPKNRQCVPWSPRTARR
jgi:hypothetical protein